MPPALIAEKDFAGQQAVGQRTQQEDAHAFSAIPEGPGAAAGLLLVVGDGMGGHAAGNRASEVAVRAFAEVFCEGSVTMDARFERALLAANAALAAAVEADLAHLEGMGTTLVAVAATPLGLEWISIGDSPLYLFREGALRRVNADHSFRPLLVEMVGKGELTEEQAATSALKNRLRSALIGGDIALVDRSPVPLLLLEGDIVLAGSDGLLSLRDEDLAVILRQYALADAAPLAARILDAVLGAKAPKQDNITVTIFKPPGAWLRSGAGL